MSTKPLMQRAYKKIPLFHRPKNEPNVKIGKINITSAKTKNYENKLHWSPKKTNPMSEKPKCCIENISKCHL